MPNGNDGLNSPELKRIKDQTNYFNRNRAEYNNPGKGKPLPVGFKSGGQVVDSVSPDNSTYFWSNADSSQVSDQQKAGYPDAMKAKGYTGKHILRDREVPPPPPRLQDSVFAKLTPQSVMEMPQTRLNGRVVCTAEKGCVVEQPFNMEGKTMAKHGHEGKAFTQMNEAGYLAQTGNPADRKGLQNSWNAGSEVMPELEKLTAQGDTARVRKTLESMQGFKPGQQIFRNEMRRDTIPEQAQYVGQQEMNDMRNQGLDVSSYKGYANKDEAKKTAMFNPVREKAFSAFEQKLQNSLKKKP